MLTSFNPELLERSNKYFGVSFENRVSHAEEIDYETALEFIKEENKDK